MHLLRLVSMMRGFCPTGFMSGRSYVGGVLSRIHKDYTYIWVINPTFKR